MVRHRRHRQLLPSEREHLLAALGTARRAVLDAPDRLRPESPAFQIGQRLVAAIDAMAEVLTGNREHFWTPLHSTSDLDGSKRKG